MAVGEDNKDRVKSEEASASSDEGPDNEVQVGLHRHHGGASSFLIEDILFQRPRVSESMEHILNETTYRVIHSSWEFNFLTPPLTFDRVVQS